MTAPTRDAVAEFRLLIPTYASRQLHDTQRLVVLVHKAVNNGWTPTALARECGRDLAGVANAAAVVMWRLEQAADGPPAEKTKTARRPLCGHCEDGYVVDEKTRLPVRRCPCRTTQPERKPA